MVNEAHCEPMRPHAVLLPVPAQGHINPMFKLAKLLHQRGFHITFVNTEYNYRRLLKCQGTDGLQGHPRFRFATISGGKSSDCDITKDHLAFIDAVSTKFLASFRHLVTGLNNSASLDVPPVTYIISDAFMSFALDVAEDLRVPAVLFWAFGASTVFTSVHLIENGFLPPKDENSTTNSYLDTIINGIPQMNGIRLKDLPSYFQDTGPNDLYLHFTAGVFKKSYKGSPAAVIVNTFEDLESSVVQELSSIYPALLTIGPLHQLDNQAMNNKLGLVGTSLFREDVSCLPWLDSKPCNSVLFVSFGTSSHLKPEQLIEFAWGLANSKQHFLWVIRSDLVIGDTATLPSEFESEIKERALLTTWCPQEEVLCHPAIGGHLTHSGWNSMLESISAGVPMLCWPSYGDQPTNSWICCEKWGTGIDIGYDVKRDGIERLVRELMSGQKGKEMKEKAMEWKKKVEKAWSSTGSSCLNFEELVRLLQKA